MPANPFTNSVWLRPPRAKSGQQPTLTRDQIVRTAIEILDTEGESGLSMRKLGTRLGAGATSLYWYVAHKDELMELAVDEVFGEVYVPEVGDTSWRIGASVLANGMRDMLVRHRWVLGQLGNRPNMGPNAMRMGDRTVALLVAAGFTGVEVSHASSLLMSHAIGAATSVAAATNIVRDSGHTLSEMFEEIRPHVDQLAEEHPDYGKWWRETASQLVPERMFDEGFAFGLERILDGLDLWLKSRP
ncbi:TetR/AcrR family transcriptional regulator [Virgisporangium aurantiacum]|uniref:TetR family transcriptional regulator n=1 Tax=Virgisporangium aurantiacum TaxID=175570 RepID=A0A8J4E1G5_9ACTN|nr:TetR/AcrR family transcriptional regulator [Virgisporangium aurantiacum]GIJ55977.1 TetR family transcriptional regulator [Virgisporangium aurantiacum]